MAKFITDEVYHKGRADVRNFILYVDEPLEHGGTDKAPTPSEYLLVALASCMAITMKMYAERKEWHTGKITVECNFHTTAEGEKIIQKKVHFDHRLEEEKETRLLFIGNKCPVHKMLNIRTDTV